MTTDTVTLKYVGNFKISAIKAVRAVCGTDLKAAKDAVEANYFIVTSLQKYAIFGFYMVDHSRPYMMDGEATPQASIFDWREGGEDAPDFSGNDDNPLATYSRRHRL